MDVFDRFTSKACVLFPPPSSSKGTYYYIAPIPLSSQCSSRFPTLSTLTVHPATRTRSSAFSPPCPFPRTPPHLQRILWHPPLKMNLSQSCLPATLGNPPMGGSPPNPSHSGQT